jgi:DNA modification methylase
MRALPKVTDIIQARATLRQAILKHSPVATSVADSQILTGDSMTILPTLQAKSVQCCVTSPPYWGLRDYDHSSQIGAEQTPVEYVKQLVELFGQVRRVLRDDGTVWLNVRVHLSDVRRCRR